MGEKDSRPTVVLKVGFGSLGTRPKNLGDYPIHGRAVMNNQINENKLYRSIAIYFLFVFQFSIYIN
jgi:hypothetical protein